MEILSRMFASWIFVIYHLFVSFQFTATQDDCSPVYVRWARVRLNLTARVAGPYSLDNCTKSCNKGDNPARPGFPIECSGFNHKQGANSLSHDCQLFQRDQLLNVDGHVEADDRYAFYWKYCAKTKKVCKSLYQFDFYIDRFMDSSEILRTINTDKVEDCLSRCLDETEFTCRSISFNRTASVCSLSPQSQISKPGYLRVNNNPNYRIDYYENNCYNVSESFTFHHDCRDNGIVVSVESKFQYTGALYGLYDFFTCRIEPKNETRFSLFFPYSSYSKNCTDSYSEKESNHVLDVVLSTDGMEPLYFLTDQDLLYKAKCPLNNAFSTGQLPSPSTIGATVVFLAPAITTTTPQFESSSLSTTMSSSTQSSESTPPITASYLSSTNSSVPTSSSGDDYKTTLHHDKKPFVTLPVLDFTPNMEKADSEDVIIPNKGNKITVVLKYPRNDLFHETDEITSLFETATERSSISPSSLSTFTESTSSKSMSTESTSSKSTSIEITSSASAKSSSLTSASAESSTFTTTGPTSSAITSESTTTIPTTITTTAIPVIATSQPTTAVLSTRKALQRFTDIIHLESKIDVDNSAQFVDSDHIPHITKSHAVLSSSTNEKPTSVSSRSSSTLSSTARSTTTSFETTKQSTTVTTTSTSEPSTNGRTTSDTVASSTERNSRFDPFGGGRQSSDLPSAATTSATATVTASTSTAIPTTTSRNKFGTEFSLDRTTNQPTSISSQTKSVLTNATTTLATTTAPQKVLFDVFHNNQPVNAVVVGSRITLSFASGLGVPASYISLVGCQVEPVNSPYSWERDPLQIVKNGCQADGVGLVCPPTRTEFGVKVEMEAFRYTTTSEVLYSCLVRVCAFNPCPQPFCNAVDGCDSPNAALPVLINSRGRRKRQQIPVPNSFSNLGPSFQVPGAFQQNLLGSAGIQQNQLASAGVQPNLGSAGDIVVSKKLVVVNSENELQYFLRTGNVPTAGASFNAFVGR